KQDASIVRSRSIADGFCLHLRLNVKCKRAKSAGGIAESGGLYVHLAAVSGVGGGFEVGKTVLLENSEISRIDTSGIRACLRALWAHGPAIKALWQNPRLLGRKQGDQGNREKHRRNKLPERYSHWSWFHKGTTFLH